MLKNRAFTVLCALVVAFPALTSPAHAVPVHSKYKSCSYPPSPGPSKPYKPNMKSWKSKGLGSSVKGVDISMWQHPGDKPINFKKLKSKYGVSFVFIKASDGGNRDSSKSAKWFRTDGRAAREAGLVVGPYHYAVPGQLGSGMMIVPASKKSQSNYDALVATARANRHKDAVVQARQAYKNSQKNPRGDLPQTLDFEERPCGWSWTNVSAWTRDFLIESERLSGRKPIIYANGYFVNKLASNPVRDLANPSVNFDFSVYPLWKASWSRTVATVPATSPIWGDQWTFWQFTSDGALKDHKSTPTVPSFRTDLDVFNGTVAQLKELASR